MSAKKQSQEYRWLDRILEFFSYIIKTETLPPVGKVNLITVCSMIAFTLVVTLQGEGDYTYFWGLIILIIFSIFMANRQMVQVIIEDI